MQITPVNLESLFSSSAKGTVPSVSGVGDFSRSLQEQETVRYRDAVSRAESSSSRSDTGSADSRRDRDDVPPAKAKTSATDRREAVDRPERRDADAPVSERESVQDDESAASASADNPATTTETTVPVAADEPARADVAAAEAVPAPVAMPGLAAGALLAPEPEAAGVDEVVVEERPLALSVVPPEVSETVDGGQLKGPASVDEAVFVAPVAPAESVAAAAVQASPASATLSASTAVGAVAGETIPRGEPKVVASPSPSAAAEGATDVRSLNGLMADRRVVLESLQVREAQPSVAATPASPVPVSSQTAAEATVGLPPSGSEAIVPAAVAAATQVAPTLEVAKKPVAAAGESLGEVSDQRFAQLLGGKGALLKEPSLRAAAAAVSRGDENRAALLDARPPEVAFAAPSVDGDGFAPSLDGAQPEVSTGMAAIPTTSPSTPPLAGVGLTTPQAPISAASVAGTPAATSALPMAEEKVISQVVGKLTLERGEGKSSITMHLLPEELGRVRLELAVEGDRVRAQFHAQSQQVQEILEKHLPKLREAFETQGLKLDEVRVSSDASQQQGGQGFYQDQRQSAPAPRFASRGNVPVGVAAQVEVPVYRSTLPQGSISLRV